MIAIQSQMSKTVSLRVLHLEKKDVSLHGRWRKTSYQGILIRMRSNGLKLQEGRFRLDMWMKQLHFRISEVFSILHDSVSLIRINALFQPSYFFTGIHLQSTVLSKYLRPHTDLLGGFLKLLWYREKCCPLPHPIMKSQMQSVSLTVTMLLIYLHETVLT